MNPRVEARLAQVMRTGRIGHRLCVVAMVIVGLAAAALVVLALLFPDGQTCDFNGVRFQCSELSAAAKAFVGVSMVVGLALLLAGLYRLSRLFQHYSRGEIFTRDSVREIRGLGYLALANAIVQVVVLVATVVLIGTEQVSLPDNTQLHLQMPFGALITAALILLVSWVMDVGTELREESELTV